MQRSSSVDPWLIFLISRWQEWIQLHLCPAVVRIRLKDLPGTAAKLPFGSKGLSGKRGMQLLMPLESAHAAYLELLHPFSALVICPINPVHQVNWTAEAAAILFQIAGDSDAPDATFVRHWGIAEAATPIPSIGQFRKHLVSPVYCRTQRLFFADESRLGECGRIFVVTSHDPDLIGIVAWDGDVVWQEARDSRHLFSYSKWWVVQAKHQSQCRQSLMHMFVEAHCVFL